jgi:hypothetical protein
MWNLKTQQLETKFNRGGIGWCKCAIVGLDKEYVLAGIGGIHIVRGILVGIGSIMAWDKASGQSVGKWQKHTVNIVAIIVNPIDPLEFTSAGVDGKLVVYVLSVWVIVFRWRIGNLSSVHNDHARRLSSAKTSGQPICRLER